MLQQYFDKIANMAERAREKCKQENIRVEYPKNLKKISVQLLKSGVSNYKLGEVLGIHYNTVFKWKRQFISVKSLPEITNALLPASKSLVKKEEPLKVNKECDIKVTLPSGIIIESSDCNELLKVIREFKHGF